VRSASWRQSLNYGQTHMIATLRVRESTVTSEPSAGHPAIQLVVLSASGRLDASTVNILERALIRGFAMGSHVAIVDMGEVTYISSSGLRVLLSARRQAREKGGDLVLCSLSTNVRDVMDMVGFTVLFTISDTVELAIKATTSQGA
jgi:anti-anti-sigma factor